MENFYDEPDEDELLISKIINAIKKSRLREGKPTR